MRLQFPFGQLSRLREDARLMAECAAEYRDEAEALATSTREDLERFEDFVATADPADERCLDLLVADLPRRVAVAEAVERLCAGARRHHLATMRLLTYLGGRTGTAGCRQHVLVADDSAPTRDLVASVLVGAGFVVGTAADGLQTLLAAYDMRPSVIVMDVAMPVLDGIQATKLIKAAEATRHAQVIAHTGSLVCARDAALFAAVLEKPSAANVLLAAVQHHAGR